MRTKTMERRRSSRSAPLLVFLEALAASIICSTAGAQDANQRPDVRIDAAARSLAITNLAKEIESNYPFAEPGKKAANELRSRLRRNRYQQTSAKAFASTLTDDLRALTGDQHFLVDYFVMPRVFPPVTETADPVSEADHSLTVRLQNFGFARLERLPGNVGYIKLDHFETPTVAGATAAAAMQFLSGTDAMIIDLRDNGGGYSSMVSLLASYFFAEPVHLSDISGRNAEDLRQDWTYAFLPGPRYLDKPVYILSGPRTFSAAEAFAYDLQAQKRAKIVGETTRGGVSPSVRLLLSSRFGVIMPSARVRNAVTGTNWEGGLKPDVSTSAQNALSVAHLAALETIASRHKNDPLTTEIEKSIGRVKGELAVSGHQ